jgi:hypothetical protein
LLALVALGTAFAAALARSELIHIAFLWHMHQPIYWPGESVVQTAAAAHYGFDVVTVHTDRNGPYTTWPSDAIGAARAAGLLSAGAQVSFSGSLMENLDALEAAGRAFGGWKDPWRTAASWRTSAGNPAIDLVGFGYFHPLSALVEPDELVMQIRLHREAVRRRFPGLPASRGMFPPETGFSVRMIPALVEAGVEWILVDNVHFDRTLPDYPYTPSSNLVPPNRADRRNEAATSWVRLDGIWAPSPVAAPWGYQPHRARHIDPATGAASGIVVVPAARYEGNEDARGGFGALNYDAVLSQLAPHNTDPAHPILVVLHHDGDNYGGGTDSYYHGNFAGLVSWLRANPDRFRLTTVEDYLAAYPPAPDDFIHVEDGSWSGADNGDPEFLKWNGDPAADGYSPDRHSWAVHTAAVNRVRTALAAADTPSVEQVLDGSTDLARAWRMLLTSETSCYWYWDNAEGGTWDSHPARAANRVAEIVDPILAGGVEDRVPPAIYPPQREPYNPGEIEWGTAPQPQDMTVWTYVYDVSDVAAVRLWYRFDADARITEANHVFDSTTWCVADMARQAVTSRTDPTPRHVADRYEATLAGFGGWMLDYFVEAEDGRGNTARSDIRHVWIGDGGGGPGPSREIRHYPSAPSRHDAITVVAWRAGDLHWGINEWNEPPAEYRPPGTTLWGDGRAADTPLAGPGPDGRYSAVVGPFDGAVAVNRLNYTIHYADGSWPGSDWRTAIDAAPGTAPRVEIAEPDDGDRVRGTVRLIAAASDDGGAPEVEFLIDGVRLATVAARPYEVDWDTTTATDGDHPVTARARDGDGTTAEDSVTVTVGGGGTTPDDCTVPGDFDGGTDAGDGATEDGGTDVEDAGTDAATDATTDAGTDAGRDGGTPDGGDGDGCGCRAAGSAGAGAAGRWMVFALGAAAVMRRRRERRSGRTGR